MEMDHNVGTPGTPFMSAKPSSPAPGRSNPHTPASPHIPQPVCRFHIPAYKIVNDKKQLLTLHHYVFRRQRDTARQLHWLI